MEADFPESGERERDAAGPETPPARRGRSVRYKNKTLLSTIDPVGQAERAAAKSCGQDRTLYFCPSPLLGYGLDTLLARLGPDSAVLCAETDRKLLALSLTSIGGHILNHPRFLLSGSGSGADLCALIRERWGARVFRRVETVKLSGGWQLDREGYEGLADFLQRDLALGWGNAMTLVKLGRRFMRNSLRNLAPLGRARPLGEASFGARPVLILGAGPSLDPVLDGLARAGLFGTPRRSSFGVICVDTCLSVLRERGIRPDLTVILESQFWNMKDFTGFRNAGIPAALDLSAYPAAVDILGGPVFFFFTPWTGLRIFERMAAAGLLPPALPPLGSVGISAVELARRLSSGPLVTAGIDFSFTPERMHARSSPAHLGILADLNRFKSPFSPGGFRQGVFTTLSKSGTPVKSDPAMRTYRGLFERHFAGEKRIRDIAGSGLPLGLDTLDMEEAVLLLGGGPPENPSPERKETPGIPPPEGPEEKDGPGAGNPPASAPHIIPALGDFIRRERALLEQLRDTLTGGGDREELERLLDEADYLWAHFPDCAGAEGRRPPASDLGFLKRVRAETDPFITLWNLAAALNG
ncbi:MAG: DUF115 domain-containing protein [Treponema sp.]|jgi:hypothetical protein|nr:DUF115 domain-containing protein [Treponema sp.]